MKVMMMVKANKQADAGQKPTDEALVAMHHFNEELRKAGVLLDLGGLTPMSRGALVRYSKSQCKVIDGPFAEAKELIAGYSLLEVKTFAEAIEWARRAPFGLLVQDGEEWEVELRPLFDPTEFDVPGEAEERAKRLGEKPGKA
ncbi:YciI family protein [Corallococcus llansteffanensis]|uniref:YciI family protein n=1 Tax=Corallococcus llansteffanensis TaxID=2316731 RepID=A0A3A8Q2C4_9BACT|nr:YciI family protein [Corallococcus llansteffanensis]RKH62813.1 YciI family protein [Corallococcus llansteffanensis]